VFFIFNSEIVLVERWIFVSCESNRKCMSIKSIFNQSKNILDYQLNLHKIQPNPERTRKIDLGQSVCAINKTEKSISIDIDRENVYLKVLIYKL